MELMNKKINTEQYLYKQPNIELFSLIWISILFLVFLILKLNNTL